jgi:hypothetical protein
LDSWGEAGQLATDKGRHHRHPHRLELLAASVCGVGGAVTAFTLASNCDNVTALVLELLECGGCEQLVRRFFQYLP